MTTAAEDDGLEELALAAGGGTGGGRAGGGGGGRLAAEDWGAGDDEDVGAALPVPTPLVTELLEVVRVKLSLGVAPAAPVAVPVVEATFEACDADAVIPAGGLHFSSICLMTTSAMCFLSSSWLSPISVVAESFTSMMYSLPSLPTTASRLHTARPPNMRLISSILNRKRR